MRFVERKDAIVTESSTPSHISDRATPTHRRRRHLVTAVAGFVVGVALIVGTATSSGTPSAVLYDSWQSNAWRLAPTENLGEQEPRAIDIERTREVGLASGVDDPDARNPGRERTRSAGDRGDAARVVTGEKPSSVSIPSMGVQASVIPVGLDDGGGVFVPDDVRTLGWYTASVPVAADQGSAVIVGHRDSAVQGAGAFSGIENLAEGEVIEVVTASGDVETYIVEEVKVVAKSNFASVAEETFTLKGEHRLTLITCGGAFDSSARSYVSNVFVIATQNTA